MVWWQWIVLGVVLLGAEMMVDAEFYLVFLGVSALTVGLLDLSWADSPIWAEWFVFSLIAIVSLLLFRGKFYAKIRGKTPDRGEGMIGEIGIVEDDIEAGGTGRIELRGTTWSAHNVGERVLPQNARVRVDAVSGLTVEVRSADS